MKKKAILVALVAILITVLAIQHQGGKTPIHGQEATIGVYLNGKEILFDTQPILRDNRTMVPFRGIFEALDMEVLWDGTAKKVTATNNDTHLELYLGKKTVYRNSIPSVMDVAPLIIDGRTMVPLRYVAENTGLNVAWDAATRRVLLTSAPEGQKGMDQRKVTSYNVAIILIDFEDTKDDIKALYPTKADIAKRFFDENSVMNTYLREQSYGVFKGLKGEVFGPFTHPLSLEAYSKMDYEAIFETGNKVTIPGFNAEAYDMLVYLYMNDYNANPSAAMGRYDVTINGKKLTTKGIHMGLHIGHHQRDTNYPLTNALKDPHIGQLFEEGSIYETDLKMGQMTAFERTMLHELIHGFGIQTHANAMTNGDKKVERPGTFGTTLNEDYGNSFAIMGTSDFGLSMTSAYRDYLGWYDPSNQKEILEEGTYRLTISPDTVTEGIKSCEIRIPYAYSPLYAIEGHKNEGYFIEVRNSAYKWDTALKHPALSENEKGVMITYTDGYTAYLVDASPSKALVYDFDQDGHKSDYVADKRDVVLKPGETYESKYVTIKVLGAVEKGFDIEVTLRKK